MTSRRKRQQRGIALSFAGITVGFLIGLSFDLAGFWRIDHVDVGIWYLVTIVVHLALGLALHRGWPWYFARDPHFLYLPWAAVISLLALYVYAFPEARVLVPFGFFVNLLFVVGLAGFWETLVFSGFMAASYLSVVLLLVARGEPISTGYESMIAGLLFALGAFAGTVLERAKRERLERRDAALQLRKLSLAVDQSPSLVVITDTDGRIEYVNPRFLRTTGYSLEEVVGRTPRLLKSPDTPPELYEDLWRTIRSGEVWQGELKNLKKNGEPFWVISSISPLRDGSGSTTHYLGVQEDITERKDVESQLAHAQKMESVGQLVSGVAHDFNNLMTGVLGFTELALTKLDEESPAREDLMEVKKAGRSAGSLTQQLLAFGRQQMLRPEVLNLNDVLASIEPLLRRSVTENVQLRTMLSPDLGLVRADPAQIQQILVNLAVNARDAMSGGGRLLIETSNAELGSRFAGEQVVVRPGEYVLLTVSDNGRGMDEQTRQRVFEPFFTTKERGRGTGLGLATVYGIVKQSRGYIWVYSEQGEGTTFKIFLPRVATEPVQMPSAERPATDLSGRETILLVEDDEVVRTLAQSILESRGYAVRAAADAAGALQLARDDGADLLITDIVLPGMNGVELADRLTREHPGLKVLLMSGYAEQAIVDEKLANPETPFIGKPFKVKDFLSKVRGVLDG